MDTHPALIELLRPALFFGLLVLISMLEQWRPLRLSDPQRLLRWPSNLSLVAIGLAITILLQLSLLGGALWAEQAGFGLLHHVDAPPLVEAVLAWLLLDLAMYAQHRALHEIPWLWPLHRVHHSDVEFDVTTGLRFHPGEVLLAQLFKLAVILLLGAPWGAVLAFEIGLALFTLLTHANFRLSPRLERILRALVVTPDMHRTHHSVHADEMNSNFGNVLSGWDRLLASYSATSREPPREMCIGLPRFRVPTYQSLRALLVQPLER
jgi:sterol desaturase/sphingolipid hydroxylase (fatty acid hydroxylase superfamily)